MPGRSRQSRHQSQPCGFKILVGRPARLQATRSLEPGRSSLCELFARCAGVHVDFHAHRHFDNPRSFPGHWVLHIRHIRRDARAELKVRPPPPTRKSYHVVRCGGLRRLFLTLWNADSAGVGYVLRQNQKSIDGGVPGRCRMLELRTVISIISRAPARLVCSIPWRPGFHPCLDLPH
jgi:hypothetical protein